MHGHGRDVDAVAPQALEVQRAEIVVAHGRDDRGGMAELADLVDEDRRRTAREGADQRLRLQEAVAGGGRHDLHQDLADGDDLACKHGRFLDIGEKGSEPGA